MKPEAPTTTNESQTFCAVTNPTVSDIQVNESNILWYDVPSGGTPLDPSSGLVDGASYYGAQVVDGCESPLRLEVNVSINDTPTPTTDNSQQTFCVVDQPLVSDLQVDGPNIVWYNASTGGTPYAPTDPLLDGQSYYATATDTTGCESSIRLDERCANCDNGPSSCHESDTAMSLDFSKGENQREDGGDICSEEHADSCTILSTTQIESGEIASISSGSRGVRGAG